MEAISAKTEPMNAADGPHAPLPYSIDLYRPGVYDTLLPWDVHCTVAVVEAMRRLSLTSRPVDREVRFETEEARDAVLARAEELHREAVARHCRNIRRIASRQRVNRLP